MSIKQHNLETLEMDMPIPGTSIVPLVEQNPALVLINRERFDEFYSAIEAEAKSHKPDLATEKGRKAIASLAFKIARTKTAIDDAGKKLNEQARQQIGTVDAARRNIRDRLDALRDEVRNPLTAWESAEDARKEAIAARLAFLDLISVVHRDTTGEQIAAVIETVSAMTFDPDVYQDRKEEVEYRRAEVLKHLRETHGRIEKEEADRAELDRLRAEAEQRAEADRVAAETKAAAEQEEARKVAEAEAAAAAERDRVARAERLAQEQEAAIAKAAQDAEARAKADAERAAQAEQDRRDAEHKAELARVQAVADEAARREKAREAETAKVAAEERRRAENVKHRSAVMRAAKEALMKHADLDEDQAKRVVLAISGNHVPHVGMVF